MKNKMQSLNICKIRSLVLLILLSVFQLVMNAQYTLSLNDIEFNDTTGTITKYLNKTEKNIEIPSSFNVNGQNITVNAIGRSAFSSASLLGVTLPCCVKKIEYQAFMWNYLDSIDLSYVTFLGQSAFRFNQLTKIVFPINNAIIEPHVFSRNQLKSVTIPRNITEIQLYTFEGNKIERLVIPDNVTSIGAGAFNNNAIAVVNGKTSKGIIYARNENGIDDSTRIVSYGGVADVIDFIPNKVTKICNSGFIGNQLTDVTIPNSIDTIDISAFAINNLTTLNLPCNVTYIGREAFENNYLTSVKLSGGLRFIGSSAFAINNLPEIVIPNGVETISVKAFFQNSLTKITLPNSVTLIGNAAFNDNAITSINEQVSDGIIYARNDDGTTDSTTIVSFGGTAAVIDFIPNRVTTIVSSAFEGNYTEQITSVLIPDSILFIGYYAFCDNKLLKNIILPVACKNNQTFTTWQNIAGDSIAAGIEIFDVCNQYTAVFNTYTITFNICNDSYDDMFMIMEGKTSKQPNTSGSVEFSGFENGYFKYTLLKRKTWEEPIELATGEIHIDENDVVKEIRLSSMGINTNEDDKIRIYPNPVSTGILNIEIDKPGDISITNLNGHIVYKSKSCEILHTCDVTELLSGIYFIKTEERVYKFIKK